MPITQKARGGYAKSRNTVERILTAALEVAAEHGFQNTTTANIAAAAGVAQGSIYYHFGSREEVLAKLPPWIHDKLLDTVRQATEGLDDFFAIEEAGFRAYLHFLRDYPAYIKLSEECRFSDPDLYTDMVMPWIRRQRSLLDRAARAGQIRPLSSGELDSVSVFFMGLRSFVDRLLEGFGGMESPPIAELVDAYMTFIRGALAQDQRR